MNIFVKGLEEDINGETLRGIFSKFGEVISAKVIYDRVTSESRGFGFVEMEMDADGQKAIEELNGKEYRGKELEVKEADDRGRKNDSGGRW